MVEVWYVLYHDMSLTPNKSLDPVVDLKDFIKALVCAADEGNAWAVNELQGLKKRGLYNGDIP